MKVVNTPGTYTWKQVKIIYFNGCSHFYGLSDPNELGAVWTLSLSTIHTYEWFPIRHW